MSNEVNITNLANVSFAEEMEEALKIVKNLLGNWDATIELKDIKSVRKLGCCISNQYKRGYFLIEISSLISSKKEKIKTCIHELLHTRNLFGGHTGNWLKEAKIISEKTEYTIQRLNSNIDVIDEAKADYKYHLYCSNCNSLLAKYKKETLVTKHPELYTTKCCRKKIIVKKVD